VKQRPDESYEHWIKRVEQYEFGRALMALANGADPEQVLEETSYRIMKKLEHPIIETINNSVVNEYDSKESQLQYQRNYQDRFGPKPDHIKDD
jgi:glutamyl-tRNA reductase